MRASYTLGGIDTKTVDAVCLDELLDPAGVSGDDSGVRGVEIRKGNVGVAKPAQFFTCVVTVVNGAVCMVLGLQWDE